jgi:hypothetical protein
MSLAIRKKQTKTTMRYCFTHQDGYKSKRHTVTSVGEEMKELEPSYVAGEIRKQSGNSPVKHRALAFVVVHRHLNRHPPDLSLLNNLG